MMLGSRGIGGRRYQIAAELLTYAAVSLSVIPISLSQYIQEDRKGAADENASGAVETVSSNLPESPEAGETPSGGSFAGILATLAMYGLLSPFSNWNRPSQACWVL